MCFARRFHLTMNKTNNTSPLGALGSFAPSGFFANSKARPGKPIRSAHRRSYEAATPVQAARLFEVFGPGTSSYPRFDASRG